jgi:hypothetical protein
MRWLDRLREKHRNAPSSALTELTKAGATGAEETFVSFGSAEGGGADVFSALLVKYPPDELGEPCPQCAGKEKWRWLDGRLLCRPCLVREAQPTAGTAAASRPGRPQPW